MLSQRRIQYVELQDLTWIPAVLRNGVTDYLQFILSTFRIYDPIFASLEKLALQDGAGQIIDLCSGGGGAIPAFARKTKTGIRFRLTDLYPNLKGWEKFTSLNLYFESSQVDARSLPSWSGLRTLFTSFHHFNDEDARAILQDAYLHVQPISVNEFTQRDLRTFLLCLPSALIMFFLLPFSRPRFSTLVFTYLLPLVPLIVGHDILVSVLRNRSKKELLELTEGMTDFDWKVDEVKTNLGLRITSLQGKKRGDAKVIV